MTVTGRYVSLALRPLSLSLKTSPYLAAEASGWKRDATVSVTDGKGRKEPSWASSEQGSEGKTGLNILT